MACVEVNTITENNDHLFTQKEDLNPLHMFILTDLSSLFVVFNSQTIGLACGYYFALPTYPKSMMELMNVSARYPPLWSRSSSSSSFYFCLFLI